MAAIAKKKRKRNKNNARNNPPQKGKTNKRNSGPPQQVKPRKDSEVDENERFVLILLFIISILFACFVTQRLLSFAKAKTDGH